MELSSAYPGTFFPPAGPRVSEVCPGSGAPLSRPFIPPWSNPDGPHAGTSVRIPACPYLRHALIICRGRRGRDLVPSRIPGTRNPKRFFRPTTKESPLVHPRLPCARRLIGLDQERLMGGRFQARNGPEKLSLLPAGGEERPPGGPARVDLPGQTKGEGTGGEVEEDGDRSIPVSAQAGENRLGHAGDGDKFAHGKSGISAAEPDEPAVPVEKRGRVTVLAFHIFPSVRGVQGEPRFPLREAPFLPHSNAWGYAPRPAPRKPSRRPSP